MDVRDLIRELLEFDMDMEVNFEIGDDEVSDFELTHAGYKRQYLHFKLNVKGEELVDSDDLQALKDRVEDLESQNKELEEVNEILQRKVDEHE